MLSILGSLAHGLLVLVLSYALLYLSIVYVLGILTPAVTMPGGQRVRMRFDSWLPKRAGHDALTVFGVIWVAKRPAPPAAPPVMPALLVGHEFGHVLQERALWYVGFLPKYFYWQARKGYNANPMERDAWRYANAHVKEFVSLPAVADQSRAA